MLTKNKIAIQPKQTDKPYKTAVVPPEVPGAHDRAAFVPGGTLAQDEYGH